MELEADNMRLGTVLPEFADGLACPICGAPARAHGHEREFYDAGLRTFGWVAEPLLVTVDSRLPRLPADAIPVLGAGSGRRVRGIEVDDVANRPIVAHRVALTHECSRTQIGAPEEIALNPRLAYPGCGSFAESELRAWTGGDRFPDYCYRVVFEGDELAALKSRLSRGVFGVEWASREAQGAML